MASDEFFRLVDTFRHLDADGLMDAVATDGTGAVLTRLRAREADDPEGHRFPRLKRSDDATAVAFEVVTGARRVGGERVVLAACSPSVPSGSYPAL